MIEFAEVGERRTDTPPRGQTHTFTARVAPVPHPLHATSCRASWPARLGSRVKISPNLSSTLAQGSLTAPEHRRQQEQPGE